MQRLTLDQTKAGFVLAKPATDDRDRTLIAEGTTLTETHIEQLRRRGVETITVAGNPVKIEGGADAFDAEKRRAFLEGAFSRHVDNPVMTALKMAFERQIDLRLAREQAAAEDEAEEGADGDGGEEGDEAPN